MFASAASVPFSYGANCVVIYHISPSYMAMGLAFSASDLIIRCALACCSVPPRMIVLLVLFVLSSRNLADPSRAAKRSNLYVKRSRLYVKRSRLYMDPRRGELPRRCVKTGFEHCAEWQTKNYGSRLAGCLSARMYISSSTTR